MNLIRKIKICFVFVLALFVTSCSADDDIKGTSNSANSTSSDISSISEEYGNIESNNVIVFLQGGPEYTLGSITNLIEGSETQSELWVNVHQVQTRDPNLFETNEISFDEAKEYAKVNAENVDKVITHFKNQGKTVYLVSVSYGSFIAADYIARFGVNNIEKAMLIAGRLDLDDALWTNFSQGDEGIFEYDSNGNASLVLESAIGAGERNKNKLAAALGYKRYTELWSNLPMLSKIGFVWGTRDERTGRLTQVEKDFLLSKNAQILQVDGATHQEAALEGASNIRSFFEL